MKGILFFVSYFVVCFTEGFQLSNYMPKVALCIIAELLVPISAYPEFYETSYEVQGSESTYDKSKDSEKVPPTTTTEEPRIPDEWKRRGNNRLQCVEELRIQPTKVVNLMTQKAWEVEDVELQKWVLCVLKKMDLMTDQGVFKFDVAMSKIPSKDKRFAEELIDHCLPVKHMEPHQIAWRYVKCHDRARGNFSAISVF